MSTAWIFLLLAAVFEIAWAVGLKYTEGFTRLWPTVGTVIGLIASIVLLAQAARTIPIGTAYAVWTGIGAAGTVLCGVIFLHDPATAGRFVCIGLILLGVVGLKIT